MKIIKVGVVSFVKIQAILMAIFGLVVGIFETIVSLYYGTGLFPSMMAISQTRMLGGWGLLFFPIFYAVLGLIMGFFGALLYNLIAGTIGGLEIELEEVFPKKTPKKEKK